MCKCKCCGWFKKLFSGKNCCKKEECCSGHTTEEKNAPEATVDAPVAGEATTVDNVKRTE